MRCMRKMRENTGNAPWLSEENPPRGTKKRPAGKPGAMTRTGSLLGAPATGLAIGQGDGFQIDRRQGLIHAVDLRLVAAVTLILFDHGAVLVGDFIGRLLRAFGD